MKNSRIKLICTVLTMFFIVIGSLSFNHKQDVEEGSFIVGWTKNIDDSCKNQYLVQCSTTPSLVNCSNLMGDRLYLKQANSCYLPLYKCVN